MNAGVLRLSSPGRWWSESEKQGLWRNVPLGQTGCLSLFSGLNMEVFLNWI